MASTSASTAPPSPLQRLPDVLYSQILQLLSAEQKLRHLTRLSHSFPPLTPLAFAHSHLHLTAKCLLSLPHGSPLPPSIFGVYSLTCDQLISDDRRSGARDASRQSAVRLLIPPSVQSPSPFSSLRRLSVHFLSANGRGGSSVLSSIFPSPAAFPVLHSLSLLQQSWPSDHPHGRVRGALALSALSHLASLHHLTLCLPLRADDWADVLTLPSLRSLRLLTCREGESLNMPPAVLMALPALLSPSCHTLTLPRTYNGLTALPHGPPSHSSPEPARAIVQRIERQTTGAEGDTGLQYLAITGGPHDHSLLLAAAFPSLTALRVDGMWFQNDAAVVLPLCANLPSLQHISCAIGDWVDVRLWTELLSSAGARLKSVHLRELHRIPTAVNEWLELLLEHCTGVESLSLAMSQWLFTGYGWNDPHTRHRLPASLASLALLHTLTLWELSLDEREVQRLLQSTPLLEDCTVRTHDITVAVLAVLGRSCPLLRRIWVEGNSAELLGEAAADQLSLSTAQAESLPQSWFPQLSVLSIDWAQGTRSDRGGPPNRGLAPLHPTSPRLLTLLPALLASSAPLRYLHIPLQYESPRQLLLWSAFPHLRGLSLIGPLPPFYVNCYFDCCRFLPTQENWTDEWWVKTSDERMEAEPRMVSVWKRVFDDAVGREGSDGRAAFWRRVQLEAEFDEQSAISMNP